MTLELLFELMVFFGLLFIVAGIIGLIIFC